MRRHLPVFVALTLLAALALPVAASAQSAPSCPVEPANAIAVVSTYGFRTDLTDTAVTAAIAAVQHAGFVPVGTTGPSTIPVFTAFGPIQTSGPAVGAACVPTLSLSVTTDMSQGLSFYVSRYSERVTVTARITMPDGRIQQASQTVTASWYSGYLPVPFAIGGFYAGSVPVSTSQGAAEQRAVQTAATTLAQQATTLLHMPSARSATPTP